jgi:gamma-glutamyltranspeptidase / glutathione hydrolase
MVRRGSLGTPGHVTGFLGGAAAEEPRAAIVARDVLSAGGTAVDAAVAGGFAMTVTLPSRAGLGGGGPACCSTRAQRDVEAICSPPARAKHPAGHDRPAAVPMLARGLFALHTRGGRLRFEQLVRPAEEARGSASRSAAPSPPTSPPSPRRCFADPQARRVFARPGGGPLQAGRTHDQLDLGATLAQLRTAGVGDLHQGALARRLEEASAAGGRRADAAELRAARAARAWKPRSIAAGNDIASFLPAEADGGQATARPSRRRWRAAAPPPAGAPAERGARHVRTGRHAVACAFTMNNLFGTGRVAPGTGILLAAAPNARPVPPAPLAAGIAHNRPICAPSAPRRPAAGQQAAGAAAGAPLAGMLRRVAPNAALRRRARSGPGLAISCPRYLPGAATPPAPGQADPARRGCARRAGR